MLTTTGFFTAPVGGWVLAVEELLLTIYDSVHRLTDADALTSTSTNYLDPTYGDIITLS